MGAANRNTAAAFWREWQDWHGPVPPLAHRLRHDGSGHNWIRFHALPLAKRYADNVAEQHEILRRADQLAAELLGTATACWLVHLGTSPAPHANLSIPEDGFDWLGRVTQSNWQRGRFPHLLTDVANGRAGPLLWMNRETGAVFAPYDGGFDLFPDSAETAERLRGLYPDWLSDRPDGL